MNDNNEQNASLTQEVRGMVEELLQQSQQSIEFQNDDSLVMSGRLSSLQVVELATILENRYGLDFAAAGFDQYDFDSVDSIVALIKTHRE